MARNDDKDRQSDAQYRMNAEQRERQRDRLHFQAMLQQWRRLSEEAK
jgi:hypothetical protein